MKSVYGTNSNFQNENQGKYQWLLFFRFNISTLQRFTNSCLLIGIGFFGFLSS